ncbi:MAG: hypothetical protein KC503_31790 [Myxococcales bacterium]|nr:hypothetical protein [Myxococcales bacterium]
MLARSGATASLDSAGNLRVQPPSTGPQQSATPQPATPADWPETPRELAETIRQSPTALGLWLSRCAELAQARVVLFVDQLEELFTMCADRAERTAFLEAVARAAEDPQEPVRVIYTARDDFLVELASTPRSRAALRNLVVLRKPSKQALAETIAGPLRAVGYSLDDSKLAEQMVNEVEGAAAALPLLQFTARMMWERRDKRARMLTRESYEAIGGVAGALATHADGVLAGLGAPDRASARALLLRLVSSNGTRRSVRREQLLDGLDAASALDRLIEARLLVTHPDDDGGEPRVELAHEALIDSWATLSRWVRDSENERAVLLELEQAAELWRKRGADEDAVWRGAALSDARRAIEGAKVPELVERFVAAGEAREARLRGRRRLFGGAVIAVLALGALTATVAAIAFARSETRARRAQRVAERQRANARRESAESALSRGRVLEARARLRASLETLDSTSSRALFARLERDPRRFIKRLPASAYDVAISPSGKRVAVAGQDSTIYVIDAQTGSTRTLRGQRDQLQSVAFAPDGKQLAVATRAGEVALFSLADDSRRILAERGPAERRVVFSPDGKLLAAGGWDGVIRLFDTRHAGAAPRELKGHEDRVYGLVFTPDGRYIASASYDRTLRLFSVADGKERARVDRAHDDRIFDLAIDPSGERLASAGWDQTVREWRLVRPAGGEPRIVALHVLSGHHSGVTSVAYAGRGGLLVSGSADRTVRLWDRNGNARGVLSGHQAGVASVAYAGGLLATASFDKTVRLWRPSVALRARAIGGHSDRVNGVAFSPDGTQVASASSDETVRLWDVATGTPQMLLRGHDDGVITVAFSHDGKRLASASWDESIALWDAARGSRQRVLIGHGSEARSLAFSRDDKLLLSGGYDRTIRLWQASSGAQVASFEAHGGGVRSVALSPDGKLIASGGGDGRVRLWRLATRKLERVVIAHKSTVTAVAFLPSGTKVLSASYDRTLRLTDLAADKTRIVGKHRSRAMTLAVHPSGRVFASGGADGQLLVWSLAADARPRPIARLRAQRRSLNSLDFARDGKKLVSGSDDGTVRVYDVALLAGDDARVTPAWRALTWQRDKGVAPALRSHRGFIWSPPAQVLAAAQPWIARAHTVREAHGALCLLTTRDAAGKRAVELWRGGKRELSQAIDDARDVHRFASGCVVLDGDRAVIVRGGGFQRQLIDHARAIAVGEDGKLYVATDRAVHIYAKNASALRRLAVPRGVSALAPIARGLAIGYESGNIGVASFGSDSRSRSRSTVAPFGQTPASRVTTIAAGPRETLVVGYESGLVGLWRQRGGARLDHSALHGAIAMLAQQGGKLYVASELGDHAVIDLSIYQLPYCALMRRVWQSSPLVADRTRLLRRAAPREHRCAPSR